MSTTRVNIGDPTRAKDINNIIPLNVFKSTSYTITDTGGYMVFICAPTAGSTITITLPTVADNKNRRLTVIKGTTATGIIKVDGEGSELINASSYIYVRNNYDVLTVEGTSARWRIV